MSSAGGREHGVTDEEISALGDYESSALFSERDRMALRYAEEMTNTPVAVPEALFAQLRQHFTDAQLVELTATAAFENFRARFDHAFGVESPGLYCPLPDRR